MNIGFISCIILFVIFLIIGLIFAVLKDKAANLISGFNSLPNELKKMYDSSLLVKGMRNSCFLWSIVMLLGALFSLLTPYLSILAFIIWLILFFKDVHLDEKKAFEKYLRK